MSTKRVRPVPKPEPRISSWGFYAIVLVAIAFSMWIENAVWSRPVVGEERIDKLTDLQSKQLDSFNENSKLLTTLATALIGAITGFLLNREKNTRLESSDFARALAAWLFAGLSLYFGHLTGRQVTWMLRAQFFDLFHDSVWWPARAQFWSFFLSGVLLADFVYRSVLRKRADEA